MELELTLHSRDGLVHVQTQFMEEGLLEVAVRHVQQHHAVGARRPALSQRVFSHRQFLLAQLVHLLGTLGHRLAHHTHIRSGQIGSKRHREDDQVASKFVRCCATASCRRLLLQSFKLVL